MTGEIKLFYYRFLILVFILFVPAMLLGDDGADSLQTESPFCPVWRSALVPGWGQLYNGKPLKASVILLTEAVFAGFIVWDSDKINEYEKKLKRDDIEPDQRARWNETRLIFIEERENFHWWLAGTIIYSMVDAYVDAVTSDYDDVKDKIRMELDLEKKQVAFHYRF